MWHRLQRDAAARANVHRSHTLHFRSKGDSMMSNSPSTGTAHHDPLEDVVRFLDLPNLYPKLFKSEHSAAWMLRRRDSNGLAAIIRWVGRTAFVSRSDFAAWFRSRSAQPARGETGQAATSTNMTTGVRAAKRAQRTVGVTR
jgi:hypothetical protein